MAGSARTEEAYRVAGSAGMGHACSMSRALARVMAVLCSVSLGGCGGSTESHGRFDAVVLTISDSEPGSNVYSCFDGQSPLLLGAVSSDAVVPVTLSPKQEYVALDDGKGTVNVLRTSDASARRLSGEKVSALGLHWSNDDRRLAYFSETGPMLADGDGSNPISIDFALPAPMPFDASEAAWAPDGSRVVFTLRGIALLVDVSTRHARMLSDGVRSDVPSLFSPDGSAVAFTVVDANGGWGVVIARTDVATSRQVGVAATGVLEPYLWSSDGQWLSAGGINGPASLFPLADGAAVEIDGEVDFSPRASELAVAGNSDHSLHVRSIDGSSDRVIATDAYAHAPVWSSDGTAIAYHRHDSQRNTPSVAVVSAVDGTELLTSNHWMYFGPEDWIARVDGGNLVTGRLRGSTAATVLPSSSNLPAFEWLDGDRIAFLVDHVLHVANADGTGAHTTCSNVHDIVFPPRSLREWPVLAN